MSSHSQSFTILVPFSPSNRKPSKKINTPNTQRPLSTIIAENEIREYNLEYQQLLIHRKELEIEM